jgi:hypothetical protein
MIALLYSRLLLARRRASGKGCVNWGEPSCLRLKTFVCMWFTGIDVLIFKS